MRESDIVKAIMRYLKTVPGCFFFKEHGGIYGTAGIPDIIACIGGHFFGFEVKTEAGKPTKLQEAVIQKIIAAGGTALVVRSAEEVKAAVEGAGICSGASDTDVVTNMKFGGTANGRKRKL